MKKMIKTTDTAYVAVTFLEPGEYDRISDIEVFSRPADKDNPAMIIKSIKKTSGGKK